MIFGRPGSGKSTFAYELYKAKQIPLHHLDKHFYEANWVERNYQEFMAIQELLVKGDHWIIDGNNTKSLELRYSNAHLVLYFNFPRWLCYFRVFKRLFKKGIHIDDRAEGCSEQVRLPLLRYMWSFEERVAPLIASFKKKYPHVRFVEIKSNKELESLKNELFR